MADFAADILQQFQAWSVLEGLGVAAAIAYLILAIRQDILCWVFAGISTVIYVYLFFTARLYMESVLNVFYLAMAVYGWVSWRAGRGENANLAVTIWPWRRHAVAMLVIVALSLVNGFLLTTYTDAEFPYIDSLTTWSAFWATFLVARKVLENWWYWLVIDVASVFIYWQRDLELTALLFVVYVIMIPFGFISWRRSMTAPVQ
ncbi:MAG: nicotinamide mononucleotide transporter [Proteobacteria bacterium]|nr:nicotinamide mononucleotide transporter [Pseudomonadota bacterium]